MSEVDLHPMFTLDDQDNEVMLLVRTRNVEYMQSVGFSLDPMSTEHVEVPEAEVSDVDGDLGSGEVGSKKWHELKLAELQDRDAISQYVKSACGFSLRSDKVLQLPVFRALALSAIEREKEAWAKTQNLS